MGSQAPVDIGIRDLISLLRETPSNSRVAPMHDPHWIGGPGQPTQVAPADNPQRQPPLRSVLKRPDAAPNTK